MRCLGFITLQHVESSRTRDQTRVPCVGMWILKHWTTREVSNCILSSQSLLLPKTVKNLHSRNTQMLNNSLKSWNGFTLRSLCTASIFARNVCLYLNVTTWPQCPLICDDFSNLSCRDKHFLWGKSCTQNTGTLMDSLKLRVFTLLICRLSCESPERGDFSFISISVV